MTQKDIPFFKMNGLGNQFIILDGRKYNFDLSKSTLRAIANKENGVNYDQLIIIENSNIAEAFMRIYNSDGTQVNACGNATRCVGALLMQELNKNKTSVETNDGKKNIYFEAKKNKKRQVTVNMGEARFKWQDIPLNKKINNTENIKFNLNILNNLTLYKPSLINVGNPHIIFWTNNNPSHYDLKTIGPIIENHHFFPEKINVSIGQVIKNNKIILRTWERGVGLTESCGTAACAAVVSANIRKFTKNKVIVLGKKGNIIIKWTKYNNILMTGDWMLDYKSTLPYNFFLLKDNNKNKAI